MAKPGTKESFPYRPLVLLLLLQDDTEPSVEVDHVPPKACFHQDFFPEGFEFPACVSCNQGCRERRPNLWLLRPNCSISTSPIKLLVIWPDWLNYAKQFSVTTQKHFLTYQRRGRFIKWAQSSHTAPSYRSMQFSGSVFRQSMATLQRKLTHALYYRETGKPLTKLHTFQSGFYQIQSDASVLTKYFAELLPNQTIGTRINIKFYR